MYYIKQSDWKRIPNDYKGKSIEDKTIKVVFEGAIPENKGKGGTTLLFEHQHFEIISDVCEMKISKGLQRVKFSEIKEAGFFFDLNKTLYKKILKQDLDGWKITCINAVSIVNGGLTIFRDGEEVYTATVDTDKLR